MKVSLVGAEMLRADSLRTEGRTYMAKLAVAFRNFTNECNKR